MSASLKNPIAQNFISQFDVLSSAAKREKINENKLKVPRLTPSPGKLKKYIILILVTNHKSDHIFCNY